MYCIVYLHYNWLKYFYGCIMRHRHDIVYTEYNHQNIHRYCIPIPTRLFTATINDIDDVITGATLVNRPIMLVRVFVILITITCIHIHYTYMFIILYIVRQSRLRGRRGGGRLVIWGGRPPPNSIAVTAINSLYKSIKH